VVGYLAAVRPQRAHAGRLSAQIDAAQAQLVVLEESRSTARALSPAELYQLARAMPVSDDMPDVLLDLDRAAATAHAQLVAVRPSPDTTLPGGSSAVPLTVVVGGSYAHVTAFLRNVRHAVRLGHDGIVATGRLFEVDGVQLSLGDGNAVVGTLQMNAFDYAPPVAPTTTGATTTAVPTTPGAEAVASP
jgi:hypothetical protein